MSPGPFLRRELTTSVRRGTAFADRRGAVLSATAVVAACVVGCGLLLFPGWPAP